MNKEKKLRDDRQGRQEEDVRGMNEKRKMEWFENVEICPESPERCQMKKTDGYEGMSRKGMGIGSEPAVKLTFRSPQSRPWRVPF